MGSSDGEVSPKSLLGETFSRQRWPWTQWAGYASAVNLARLVLAALLFPLLSIASAVTTSGHVVAVLDGDSIIVVIDDKRVQVGLAYIDAPETCQDSGTRAKTVLTGLALGKDVQIEVTGHDQHGRPLAIVSTSASGSINDAMIDRGAAWVFRRYTDDAKMLALEAKARRLQIGLWADANPMAPWEWREAGAGCGKKVPKTAAAFTKVESISPKQDAATIMQGMVDRSAQESVGAAEAYNSILGGGSSGSRGPIYTGPRGGQYFLTPGGNKQYIKR